MEFNSKVLVLLVFFLFIVFSGCTQLSPSFSTNLLVSSKDSTPIPLSSQQIITKPGYYQLVNDVSPIEVKKDSGGTCIYFNKFILTLSALFLYNGT